MARKGGNATKKKYGIKHYRMMQKKSVEAKKNKFVRTGIATLAIMFHLFLGGKYVQNNNTGVDLLSPLPLEVEQVSAEEPEIKKEVVTLSQEEEIKNYIDEVFGEDAEIAHKVAYCESGNNPLAYFDGNSNGTIDTGYFQINSVHGYSVNYLMDWKNNVDVAKEVFDDGGWNQWVCYWRYNLNE